MNSITLKHQAKLREWTAAVQECRSSGGSVQQWCRDREIAVTTYYRWEREVLAALGHTRNELRHSDTMTTTTFAELPAPRRQCRNVSERSATLHINDIAIDVYRETDSELLKMLIETVRSC